MPTWCMTCSNKNTSDRETYLGETNKTITIKWKKKMKANENTKQLPCN